MGRGGNVRAAVEQTLISCEGAGVVGVVGVVFAEDEADGEDYGGRGEEPGVDPGFLFAVWG